jgi:hypothetical protein
MVKNRRRLGITISGNAAARKQWCEKSATSGIEMVLRRRTPQSGVALSASLLQGGGVRRFDRSLVIAVW